MSHLPLMKGCLPMDLAYWSFRHWPFNRCANSDRPFVGAAYDEAFARMMFLIEERRRCGMLTGATGTGKTCLFRHLQSQALRLGRICVRINAAGLDGHEFAWRIADGCHADCDADATPARLWSSLQDCFAALAIVRQPVVTLIDHFDLIEFGCSQSLRRLMQLADLTSVDLTVLIAARERFTAPLLLDAVDLRVELTNWTEDETARFIWDTLHRAGAREAIFTADAIQAIFGLTQGNPSAVVWMCDLALLAAMSEDRREVDSNIVDAAAVELSPRERSALDRYSMAAAHE